jgi:DNA repair protein RadA/Sms
LQLANWYDGEIIYISGEETEHQISDRAKRLGIKGNNISLLSESNLENILETLE